MRPIGPKSRTQRRRATPRKKTPQRNVDLGEESITTTSDDEADQSDDEGSFQTPTLDENATDYGLEFTTHSVQNTPPHSSTRYSRAAPPGKRSAGPSKLSAKPSTSRAAKQLSTPQTARAADSLRERDQPSLLTDAETRNITLATARLVASKNNEQQLKHRRKPKHPQQWNFAREYKRLAERIDFMIPKLPFARVVREIMMHTAPNRGLRITPNALVALQTCSEVYITKTLQDAYLLSLHARRLTLMLKDVALINFIRNNF